MSKIKIVLENGETQEQAKDDLLKALNFSKSGEQGHDRFMDTAMEDLYQSTLETHKKMLEDMLKAILKELA